MDNTTKILIADENQTSRQTIADGLRRAGFGAIYEASNGEEALELRAGHHQIDVVVPGDEAVVADGAEQRAAGEEVLNVLGLADFIHESEHVRKDGVDFVKREILGVHGASFLRAKGRG